MFFSNHMSIVVSSSLNRPECISVAGAGNSWCCFSSISFFLHRCCSVLREVSSPVSHTVWAEICLPLLCHWWCFFVSMFVLFFTLLPGSAYLSLVLGFFISTNSKILPPLLSWNEHLSRENRWIFFFFDSLAPSSQPVHNWNVVPFLRLDVLNKTY